MSGVFLDMQITPNCQSQCCGAPAFNLKFNFELPCRLGALACAWICPLAVPRTRLQRALSRIRSGPGGRPPAGSGPRATGTVAGAGAPALALAAAACAGPRAALSGTSIQSLSTTHRPQLASACGAVAHNGPPHRHSRRNENARLASSVRCSVPERTGLWQSTVWGQRTHGMTRNLDRCNADRDASAAAHSAAAAALHLTTSNARTHHLRSAQTALRSVADCCAHSSAVSLRSRGQTASPMAVLALNATELATVDDLGLEIPGRGRPLPT